jgi:hypothetical protein
MQQLREEEEVKSRKKKSLQKMGNPVTVAIRWDSISL